MDNAAHFNKGYAKTCIYTSPLSWSVPDRRIRIRLLELVAKAARVLDVGCGHGAALLHFAKVSHATLFGIDCSSVAVQRARELLPQAGLTVGDVESWLGHDNIDVVYTSAVLEHVKDDDMLLHRMWRALRPGGYLCLCTVYKKAWAWYFYRNDAGQSVLEPSHVREYTSLEELRAIVETNGFIVERMATSLFWYPIIDPLLTHIPGISRFSKFINGRFIQMLRKIRVPILGYYNVQVLCKKGN
jgi:2-polyprenyl-3-methyl-5-hydroxy-6-metoxy-1,4-benzoquinol methylase